MRKFKFILLIILLSSTAHSKPIANFTNNWSYSQGHAKPRSVVLQQVELAGNNISSFFINTGILDHDVIASNSSGFEWPRSFTAPHLKACYSAGLTIGTKIEGVLKMASCLYDGEYIPGYIDNNSGIPISNTNDDFKIYKVKLGDSINSPDYANWYKMIPFGAPYIDINNNGMYDNGIDKPGIRNASETIFCCFTDGFPESHNFFTGFGGTTQPIFCEMHLTAWTYNFGGMEDVQFVKWSLINKNVIMWDSTVFALTVDPDLGFGGDDYVGCDTLLNLGYCYNADNDDSGTQDSYGANPPAFGMDFLKYHVNNPSIQFHIKTFSNFKTYNSICESEPTSSPRSAYNYLKGYKLDGTPWINPLNSQITKICYPGDPETNSGWTQFRGSVKNCNGSLTGTILPVDEPGDKKFVMSAGADYFQIQPNDTQTIVVAQMMARGSNNLNSVTKLKQLDVNVQNFFDNGLGVNNISSIIPASFSLNQNYPNPFNPTTSIKFDMMKSGVVTLKIYDASGKEVSTLINNEYVPAGTNEVSFDAKNLASGIYFYTLSTNTFLDTKKMALVK
ncbi:hypothetical protein BH10BAC5_BH10BAC5_24240 [soil metagenome]